VRSLDLFPRRQRVVAWALAIATALFLTVPLTSSTVLLRWRRLAASEEVSTLNARRREALAVATSGLADTDARLAADRDLLARIAFLFGRRELPRSPRVDPLARGPERADERLTSTETELSLLSRWLQELAAVEAEHPDWASSTPTISPVEERAFVLARPFGPGLSPLIGQAEFSTGIDIAAPAGAAVSAPADGVVRWAGEFPMRIASPYAHMGRVVVVRHERFATVFGRLESVSVRRQERVTRGSKLGTVGASPWLDAPRLRYEVWSMPEGEEPTPVDPMLCMLNLSPDRTLERIGRARRSPPRNLPPLPVEFR